MGLPEAPGGLLERRYIVVNSLWGSAPSVLLVDTTDKSITRVGDADNAHAALCVANGIAVVHTSAPEVAAGALLTVDVRNGDILASTAGAAFGSHLQDPGDLRRRAGTSEVRRHPRRRLRGFVVAGGGCREATAGRERPRRAALVHAHVGHASAALAFLVSRGFAVLSVNYRGSTGFGKALLDSLPGNIGTQDVDDCLKAIEVCCSTHNVDRERIAVVGGSHGGFLGAHLIARSPNSSRPVLYEPGDQPRRDGRFE